MSLQDPTPEDVRQCLGLALERGLTRNQRDEMRQNAVLALWSLHVPDLDAVRLVAEWLDQFEEPKAPAVIGEDDLAEESALELDAMMTAESLLRAVRSRK